MAEQAEMIVAADSRLTGIGGWLLLLIIKLWVSALIRGLGGIVELGQIMGGVNLAFALLAGTSAFLLGVKNPKGVLFGKLFLVADVIYYALELVPPTSSTNPSRPQDFFVPRVSTSSIYFVQRA